MTTQEILQGIKDWVVGKLNLKQNVIDDLETIRIGARKPIRVQTEEVVAIEPNVLNQWTSPVVSLTITFQPGTSGYVSEYMIQFTCPQNTATTLTLPNTVRWMDDDLLEPEEGYTYQISIVNNLAVYAGWEAQSNA